jgi:hypothetical protein
VLGFDLLVILAERKALGLGKSLLQLGGELVVSHV